MLWCAGQYSESISQMSSQHAGKELTSSFVNYWSKNMREQGFLETALIEIVKIWLGPTYW